ncbi:MAG: nucleotidyltransferase domain-containing protein [Prevotellaceae bacterium]|jgi:predicted nucleotidyltransferase|nr:nucleotidyltransferase domain-containing protein [Prevotellaceae bacterium]
MDKREAIAAAQKYVNNISKKYELVQAFIFGSYVKGNYHVDSDIDVAVVLKNVPNLFDTQVDLMHMRQDEDLQIEPHTFRDTDFNTDNPLVYEILQAGLKITIA